MSEDILFIASSVVNMIIAIGVKYCFSACHISYLMFNVQCTFRSVSHIELHRIQFAMQIPAPSFLRQALLAVDNQLAAGEYFYDLPRDF